VLQRNQNAPGTGSKLGAEGQVVGKVQKMSRSDGSFPLRLSEQIQPYWSWHFREYIGRYRDRELLLEAASIRPRSPIINK